MLMSVVLAVGVFIAVASYVADVNSQVGSRTKVFRASKGIDPFAPLSRDNLEQVEVPERWTSPTARLDLAELDGRRVGFRVEPGTVITRDMLVAQSDLSSTEREIAINVDAVTGVAGRVQPGDRVDIYAVFAEVPGLPKQVRVLVRDVRVVSLSGQQTVSKADNSGVREEDVIPVTLALEPNDALAVTYANAFASEVRLVALPTGTGLDRSKEQDTFDATELGGKAVPEGSR
jgi:pilus assembly protein CpaB